MKIPNYINRIGHYSIIEINGHIVSYGSSTEGFQAKCISCDTMNTFSSDSLELLDEKYTLLHLYSLHEFVDSDCQNEAESMKQVINDRVIREYAGKIHTGAIPSLIESEIKELIATPDANIDIDLEIQ